MGAFLLNDNISCIILSGGLSLRMHAHKALLRFSETENFLQHIINVYKNAGIQNIIVVKNANISLAGLDTDVQAIENASPEKGRLFSIRLGLTATRGSKYCFVHNIDNPFVTEELLEDLYAARESADYISPEYDHKGGHPILISKPVINKILGITRYDIPVNEFLGMFIRRRLAVMDESCLVNINEPSDYERFIKWSIKTQAVS